MYEVTEFYVQAPGRSALKFRDPGLAEGEAARLGRRGGRVMLFSVRGWPRFDLWDRPRLLAVYQDGQLARKLGEQLTDVPTEPAGN